MIGSAKQDCESQGGLRCSEEPLQKVVFCGDIGQICIYDRGL